MIPLSVRQVLDTHGLKALEFEEGSTPTAATAAEKIGVQVGQIAKSLVFKGASGKSVLIVCAGDRKISSGKIKRLCGEKMSMTSAEETFALTGFRPGGVCPFGIRGMDVFVDASLYVWETVYPAAGNDSTGVPIAPALLASITGALPCDVAADAEAGRAD
jgi:prolyl-tRNA editing enzyme YbaK/EbsC (Cys-tRNA(Pro) deacylase)